MKKTMTFEVYQDKAGQFRWRLKAANGQVLADSAEGYTTMRWCLHALNAVRNGVGPARIQHLER